MSTFSPELTFIPGRAPHEIISEAAGNRLVKRIDRWLSTFGRTTSVWLSAKLDPFHSGIPRMDGGTIIYPTNSWCVEICPLFHFNAEWLKPENKDYKAFVAALRTLFGAMRHRFGLVPAVIRPARGGCPEKHWPTGGCHIHYGADLFDADVKWYGQMERFHHNLLMDYANRPHIRWFLAQWFDDTNSHCPVTLANFEGETLTATRERVLDRMTGGPVYAIEPRFMASSKNSYLTFEFRFIDMAHTPEEMIAVATLIDAWAQDIRMRTLDDERIELSITRKALMEMSRMRGARLHVQNWLDSMSLSCSVRSTLDGLFTRNYANRIRHGKMR